jgi:nicotinate-nucleotide--dimethylbenzimidazole phosphoribosyltransferase
MGVPQSTRSARQVGATVHIVDVGVNGDLTDLIGRPAPHKVRRAPTTSPSAPAVTSAEAIRALDIGRHDRDELVRAGHDLLVTGDMGIGNTTARPR